MTKTKNKSKTELSAYVAEWDQIQSQRRDLEKRELSFFGRLWSEFRNDADFVAYIRKALGITSTSGVRSALDKAKASRKVRASVLARLADTNAVVTYIHIPTDQRSRVLRNAEVHKRGQGPVTRGMLGNAMKRLGVYSTDTRGRSRSADVMAERDILAGYLRRLMDAYELPAPPKAVKAIIW